jgi:hypothetical protein
MITLTPVSFLFVLALSLSATAADNASLQEQRKAAANRPRTVIYYDGGEEPLFWPKGTPFSVETFLAQRISPLKDSKVDTILYAPVSAFGFMTAKIPSADLITHQPDGSKWLANIENVMPAFIQADTDPLKEVVAWSKANNKEVFAVLCPNNTNHGTEYDFAKPPPPYTWDNYLFPPFKVKNPELLLNSSGKSKSKVAHGENPPHGIWSGVDYSHDIVRQKFFENARDICAGYDIDGLCIDFMREMLLFKSVAWGEKASSAERKLITELLRQIRTTADEAGRKRGRPILLAVRVPDSVPYGKDVGIDLEDWLTEKLVDIVIGAGRFQLNPWSYMTALSKKSGVKFYASLDESGIWVGNDSGGWVDDERLPRQCPEAYRARVMDARVAGADGVVFANRYDEDWRRHEIKNYGRWLCGDPADIRTLDKRYFVTYRTVGQAGRYLKEWSGYATLTELSSHRPATLKSGSAEYPLFVWDNLAELKKNNIAPNLLLTTEAVIPVGTDLDVTLNGRKLELIKKQAGCQKFAVPPDAVKYGANKVQLRSKGRNKSGLFVEVRNLALDVTFDKK